MINIKEGILNIHMKKWPFSNNSYSNKAKYVPNLIFRAVLIDSKIISINLGLMPN